MSTVLKIVAGDGDPRHGTHNGYTNHGCRCDECHAARRAYAARSRDRINRNQQAYRKRNSETVNALQRAYRKRNWQKARAWERKYYERNREKRCADSRERRLRDQYGITVADYDQMLAAQGGGCALCGEPPKVNALNVDHDHDSGRVRGLLCSSCNGALGQLGDTASRLTRALEYVST